MQNFTIDSPYLKLYVVIIMYCMNPVCKRWAVNRQQALIIIMYQANLLCSSYAYIAPGIFNKLYTAIIMYMYYLSVCAFQTLLIW